MSRFEKRRILLGGLSACAVFACASEGRAATNCSSLSGGNVVYGAGGNAQQPLLAQIATQFANLPTPLSVVYSDSGSACVGYGDFVTGAGVTGTALYWDSSGTQGSCTLDAGGDPVTFAVMGNSQDLCTSVLDGGLPANVKVFLGPVQSVDFVVPSASNEQSISTEAAYYVWGFAASDAAHTVSPWSTPANIFTRSTSSFVSLFVGLDTGVPVATVAAAPRTSESTAQATVTALTALNANSTAAQSGIGFVSGEVADGNRASLHVLAYQHTGQSCGYWPDSTINAFDKVNVRSGQYWLWSPVHFYATVNSSGAIANAKTATIINAFSEATTPPSGIDVFAADAAAFTVPKCAMEVWRDGDLAPPYSSEPAAPCSCKFDFAEGNANKPSTCKTCTQNSDCSTNHCRNIGPPLNSDAGASVGYCEVN